MQALIGMIALTIILAVFTFGGAKIIIELTKEPPKAEKLNM